MGFRGTAIGPEGPSAHTCTDDGTARLCRFFCGSSFLDAVTGRNRPKLPSSGPFYADMVDRSYHSGQRKSSQGPYSMEALRELCSCTPSATRIGTVQTILGKDVVRYGEAVAGMMTPSADQDLVQLYGCFAARKLLEAGCISVLCRLDPARLLILREFQLKGGYPLGERHSASIDWKGDVISEKKAAWTESVSPDKFVRSLLGGHLAEVTWAHAIQCLSMHADTIPNLGQSKWINDLLNQYETRRTAQVRRANGNGTVDANGMSPEAELGVLAGFRMTAQQVFSTLSKGVHLEFVVDHAALFDLVTVRQSMLQAVKVLTQIAFTSHFIDSAFATLDPGTAFDLVIAIEAEMERDA